MSCKIPKLKIQLPLSIDSLEMRLPCSTDIWNFRKFIKNFHKILKLYRYYPMLHRQWVIRYESYLCWYDRQTGALGGGALWCVNFAHRNIQAFRCNLNHFCIKTLSHFNTTMWHQNWSISINVNKSATLIQKLKPKGNAKHCWNNCQSSFLPFIFSVIFFNLLMSFFRFKIFMAFFINTLVRINLRILADQGWEIFLENYVQSSSLPWMICSSVSILLSQIE